MIVLPHLGSEQIVRGFPVPAAYFPRIGEFAAGGRTVPAAPVLAFPSQATAGYLGEVSLSGSDVLRSGSATTEFRYTAWAADAAGTVTAADGGVTWNHNLGTQNHVTQVLGGGDGTLGEVWVVRGTNSDTVYRSGSYTGTLEVAAVKGVNSRSRAQGSYSVGSSGKLLTAQADTLPIAVPEADPGGFLGDLYAVRESGGWRFHRTGSVSVQCRLAALALL